MKKSTLYRVMPVGLLIAGMALAQDIVSFQNGYLTFTNKNPVLYYRIEFKPNLTGSEGWNGDYGGLKNIKTNDATVAVPVGVFYRVVASAVPVPAAELQKTGQTVSYRTGDDGTLQHGVPWPVPRFTDHSDGTVTDNLTGLMWTKNANLSGAQTWTNAVDHCNDMDAYGYTDWRLPNVRELQSLCDYGKYAPALPSGHPFTGMVEDSCWWSSSTMADNAGDGWCVYFETGRVEDDYKSSEYYVWPVRGGEAD